MNRQLYIQTEHGIEPYSLNRSYMAFAGIIGVLVLMLGLVLVKAFASDPVADGPKIAESTLTLIGDITGDLSDDLANEQATLQSTKKQIHQELALMTRRVAASQARLTQLELAAKQLSATAGVSDGALSFQPIKAVGGPIVSEEEADLAAEALDVYYQIESLEQQLDSRSRQFQALRNLLIHDSWKAEAQPKGRPVTSGYASSSFGVRKDPFTGKKSTHKGMDFAARRGTDIVTVADGVVTWSGRRSGYGLLVEIAHGNGYVTRYAHNQENLVQVGDEVAAGQVVALVGSSGRSTGPHLHFEVWHKGKVVNPSKYVAIKR